ncbi:hypothetical protein C8R46DRAFT_1117471 [Mycena filopes]|nr:hypothetical protein C8R46DRAFT_1117471 [Mycena filopes]
MDASLESSLQPIFPEDLERVITELLLLDAPDLCSTLSLVASRFRYWVRPMALQTVVIRRHHDWMTRINELFVPNASFIRTLVLYLPQSDSALSEDEFSHTQRLLTASPHIQHLAVDWQTWRRLPHECGSLSLKSLYLIWDGVHPASAPSLQHLQHPSELTDLTVLAPAFPTVRTPRAVPGWYPVPPGELTLPSDLAHCDNLAWLTYVSDRPPAEVDELCCGRPGIKGVRFVLVDAPEWLGGALEEDLFLSDGLQSYAFFSTAFLPRSTGLLAEWLAKMEGRESVLNHPPPHEVDLDEGR